MKTILILKLVIFSAASQIEQNISASFSLKNNKNRRKLAILIFQEMTL
jgi:hypothetical protein